METYDYKKRDVSIKEPLFNSRNYWDLLSSEKKDFFKIQSYFHSMKFPMEILMHQIIKLVVPDLYDFDVRNNSTLIPTIVVFWISGIWRKVSRNWRIHWKLLYNFKIFNWGFDRRSQAGGFRGGRFGTLRRLNCIEKFGTFPQPGFQIRCNRQAPWMVEMNGLSQV